MPTASDKPKSQAGNATAAAESGGDVQAARSDTAPEAETTANEAQAEDTSTGKVRIKTAYKGDKLQYGPDKEKDVLTGEYQEFSATKAKEIRKTASQSGMQLVERKVEG